MKTFKQFSKEPPGAGYFGTNELRKHYVANTPGQIDPVNWETPTPQIFDCRSNKKEPKPSKQNKK